MVVFVCVNSVSNFRREKVGFGPPADWTSSKSEPLSVVDAGVRDARAVEDIERLDTRIFTAYVYVSFSDRDGTDIERV